MRRVLIGRYRTVPYSTVYPVYPVCTVASIVSPNKESFVAPDKELLSIPSKSPGLVVATAMPPQTTQYSDGMQSS
jgi:hypothetical protein